MLTTEGTASLPQKPSTPVSDTSTSVRGVTEAPSKLLNSHRCRVLAMHRLQKLLTQLLTCPSSNNWAEAVHYLNQHPNSTCSTAQKFRLLALHTETAALSSPESINPNCFVDPI